MDKRLFNFYKAALSGEITAPLCDEYRNAWRACGDDKESLMKLAMRQQSIPYVATHAYRKKGLSKELVKTAFADYANGRVLRDCDDVKGYTYQLFADASDGSIDLVSDVTSLMWCEGTDVVVPQTRCNTLYVSNKSSVRITLIGYNSLVIYLFDESEVIIEDADETCDVIVYKYSGDASVRKGRFCLCERIKEFNKELRL